MSRWKVSWTRIIRSAELGLVVAFLSLAFEFAEDRIYLALFMVCSWLVATTSVATLESLDQQVAAFKVAALTPNRIRMIAGIVFALIFGLMGLAIHHHAVAKTELASTPSKQAPAALFEAQLRELTAIEETIGRPDELRLQEEFQLPDILDHNVMLVTGSVNPSQETAEQRMEVDRFFAGGNFQIDLKLVRSGRASNGTVVMFPLAGKIFGINLSREYLNRKALLAYFESSATIPASVRKSVREFDATISTDTALMLEVMNDEYAQDPNNLYLNFDRSSSYFHTMHNAYVHRFIPLKPASDRVVASIREYLNTN